MTEGDPNSAPASRNALADARRRAAGWVSRTNGTPAKPMPICWRGATDGEPDDQTWPAAVRSPGPIAIRVARTACSVTRPRRIARWAWSTRQLNRDFDYGAVTDNQLRTLNHINYFSTDIGAATQYEAYPAHRRYECDRRDACARVSRGELRAMPSTRRTDAGQSRFPLRHGGRGDECDRRDADAGRSWVCANARIIAPGAKDSSVLWERMRRPRRTRRMPPLGTHRVDQDRV